MWLIYLLFGSLFVGVPLLVLVAALVVKRGGAAPLPGGYIEAAEQVTPGAEEVTTPNNQPSDYRQRGMLWRTSILNWDARDPLSQVWNDPND